MEMHNRNQSDLLPYEKLAILGIDREKADSLPMEVKEQLMAGEVTPIMQVSINARNGSIITMPMKLRDDYRQKRCAGSDCLSGTCRTGPATQQGSQPHSAGG